MGPRWPGAFLLAAALLPLLLARPAPAAETFDERVQEGIRKAVEYLWRTQRPDGTWEPAELVNVRTTKERKATLGGVDEKDIIGRMPFPVGTTSLCCFALLESGVTPKDPRMAKSLEWLAGERTDKTYSIGLRANVWQAASKHDEKYLRPLAADVRALIKSTNEGGYSYICPCDARITNDNSNSQYGLLGVWAGAKAELEIPLKYWQLAMQHWIQCQNRDGGWGYRNDAKASSYASMTVAGLASLYVCAHNLLAAKYAKCGVNTSIRPIDNGLAWLGEKVKAEGLNSALPTNDGKPMLLAVDPYYLFGVERVALASGYRRFGGIDWYQAGAERVLAVQNPDGSVPPTVWGNVDVATAYSVLFLARGRHPVVFNKLQFDSDWNNRPGDLAGLMRWLTKSFERTLNWQIIQITDPVEEWHDAPLLYLSGEQDPKFTDEQLDRLREFVHQGGTLFSVVECNGRAFRTKMTEVYAKLFPDYKLQPLEAGHRIFTEPFRLAQRGMYEVSNGVRPLAIHCDYDLALYWQQQRFRTSVRMFQIGGNVVAYVTGKDAFSPRAAGHWVRDVPFAAERTVKLAKLKYAGNYDPEPLAHERFRRLLGQRDRIGLEVLGPMAIADLAASGAKVATLTGTGELKLSDAEVAALKAYAEAGNTVVIDAAGGDELFYRSALGLLESVYGQKKVPMLSRESKLYHLPDRAIGNVGYRGMALKRLGVSAPPALRAVLLDERPAILLSREDLTGALLGCNSTTCDGYDPESAFRLVRNIVLSANP